MATLFEKILKSCGFNDGERLWITLGLGVAVFLYSHFTFPKNGKRVFDVVSVKSFLTLWLTIVLSIAIFIVSLKLNLWSGSIIILLCWYLYGYLYGKEVWSGLGKLKKGIGCSRVLFFSLLFSGVIIFMTTMFLFVYVLLSFVAP